MHIAFYTNSYLPYVSGVVRSLKTFRKTLSDRGHNVFIFAQEAADFEDTEPFIFRYPTLPIHLPSEFPAAIPISPFIDRVIPHLHLDVIHAHHPILLGLTALVKARDYHLPLVFTFHSNYEEYSQYFPIAGEKTQELIREAIDIWIGSYLTACQHIIAPSASMLERIQSIFEVDRRFISVIPTGIDLQPYHRINRTKTRAELGWENEIVLITLGRLALEKNLDTLIQACAKVIKNQPGTKLVIVGDGSEKKALESLCVKLGISHHVQFTGKVPYEDVPAYLSAADIFVFASTAETQGLVSLEAAAAGLPIAAVRGIGTVDVVEDSCEGFLCDDDPQALGQAIEKLVNDTDLRQRFKYAARKKAEQFEISAMAKKMEDAYLTAIEAKRCGLSVTIKPLEGIESFGIRTLLPLLFPKEERV